MIRCSDGGHRSTAPWRVCARHRWPLSGLPRFDSNVQLSLSATLGTLNPRHCRCQKQQNEYATDNSKYYHCIILPLMSPSGKPAPLVRNGRGSSPAEAAKTRSPGWASISGTILLHAHPIDYGYGTAVPDIVKWSSVMKSTLQPLHPNTLTSGSSSTPGIVRARIIGREQFGQSGDWGCIFPTDRTRVSHIGCNASPMQCFHPH